MMPGCGAQTSGQWWVRPASASSVAKTRSFIAAIASSVAKTQSFIAAIFVTLLLCFSARESSAQTDPRGAYRTFSTTHFRLHFRPAHDSIARRAAAIAEESYAALARELAVPSGPIELLLTDNLDVSNGYAQVFPTNRVVIYLLPPAFSQELRFHGDWLRLVITHELAHIFQIDRARGLWSFGRKILGRNPMLFPNAYVPSWVKEGLAVHYETSLTGMGRIASTDFRMLARAAALDSNVPSPNQWSLATSRFPLGQTVYGWGSLLMDRAAAERPDSGMRRYVDATASHIIPFRLGHNSRRAFGKSFGAMQRELRDSLLTVAPQLDTTGDTLWAVVSDRGFYAAAPRWKGSDTLYWAANDGREVAGVYRSAVRDGDNGRRLAWRNSLDANVPTAGGMVFAQHDLRDPFSYRTDLYESRNGNERRLSDGDRLAQPDVRSDGEIVAVQIGAGVTRLVRLSGGTRNAPQITPLVSNGSTWSDPRWSPRGDRIVAIEILPSAEQRVVVMDTTGRVVDIVSGARAVFGSPSFTPDGARVVWVSDRSGVSQLETAAVDAGADTSSWRNENRARVASRVYTGVFQSSVSPDGRSVAALLFRIHGFQVAVAPLDTTGPLATSTWYVASAATTERAAAAWFGNASTQMMDTLRARRYQSARQLVPRYWMPVIGVGRTGDIYGASTSGIDVLGRHEWYAEAMASPDNGEIDGFMSYRFSGLGFPFVDVSLSQRWDATLRVVDEQGAFLGDVARQRRFATLSTTWLVPRVRRTLLAQLGAQFEARRFASDSDAALGGPTSLARRGTQYHQLFGTLSASTTRGGLRAISAEEGFSISGSTAYRWRTDAVNETNSWRTIGVARGFVPIPLPGFARHVIAARVAGGSADRRTATEFQVGGVSGSEALIIPGITFGDPSRTFPLRGVSQGIQRGTRAVAATVEYRAPLMLLTRAAGPLPVFGDRLSVAAFSDAARAWCPAGVPLLFGNALCETRRDMDGWIVTAGGELRLDFAVQYDIPFRLRFGSGTVVQGPPGVPRGTRAFLTFGTSF